MAMCFNCIFNQKWPSLAELHLYLIPKCVFGPNPDIHAYLPTHTSTYLQDKLNYLNPSQV